MSSKPTDICVKITKEWGGFLVGDIVRFGLTKGEYILGKGWGEKVKKQRAVNDPPVVENAMAEPKSEKAVIDKTASPDAKAEVKADAEVKAQAPAVKKDSAKKGGDHDRRK